MKSRTLLGGAAIAATAVILTLAAPKAAHAIAATAVQVVNTRATPVPTQSTDEPGRHPYQTHCTGGSNEFGLAFCNTPNVPDGYEFVIQNVGIYVEGAAPQYSYVITTINNALMDTYIPLTAQSGTNYMAAGPMNLYQDPGLGLTCDALTASTNAGISCTFSGYLVSVP